MRKTTKLASLVLAALMLLGILTGCQQPVPAQTSAPNDAATADAGAQSQENAPAAEPTTIKFIHFRSEDAAIYGEINALFEKENPDIKVEMDVQSANQDEYYAVLKTKLSNDSDAVDVMAIHVGPWMEQFAGAGKLVDLSGTVAANQYYPDFLEAARVGDGIFGLPQAYNSYVIFYNKDIFAKYGLDAPKSWAEMENVVKVLRENGEDTIATGFSESWVFDLQIDGLLSSYYDNDPYILQKLESGEVKWTDAGVTAAYTDLQNMGASGFFQKGAEGTSYEASLALFAQGRTAMLNTGSWSIGGIKEQMPDMNMGFFILPNTKDQYVLVQDVAQSLAINSNSTKQEAAMKYVEFLSSPEVAQMYADATVQFSTVQGVVSDQPENNAVNALLDDYAACRSCSVFVSNAKFADLYLTTAAKAFGGADIATLMAEAQAETDALLNG